MVCCAAVTVRALGDWVRVSAWIQCNWREAECARVSTALPVNRRDAPNLLLRAKEAQARPTDRCGPLPGAMGRVGQVSADEGVGRFLPFYSIDSVFRCTNILNCMKSDMSISLSFSVLCVTSGNHCLPSVVKFLSCVFFWASHSGSWPVGFILSGFK